MSPKEGTIKPHKKKYKRALYIYFILIACWISLKFFLTAGTNPCPCYSGSIFLFKKQAVNVIPKESNRHNKNDSRGLKYCVKYADIIDPHIPPIATSDQA
jgi:hypothetical protein